MELELIKKKRPDQILMEVFVIRTLMLELISNYIKIISFPEI